MFIKKSFNEVNISLKSHPQILNFGALKSFQKQGIGTQIEVEKDYYFLHLSFQEYFAARYIINALKGASSENMIEFIKYQKYNQRYLLVFSFVAGLLAENDEIECLNMFWNSILEEPLDLVGLRHLELIILCLEETLTKLDFSRRTQLFEWIVDCVKHNLLTKNKIILEHLAQSLCRSQSVVSEETMIDMFIDLLGNNATDVKLEVLSFICCLNISNAPVRLIDFMNSLLTGSDDQIKPYACEVVRTFGEKAETVEILNILVSLLKHKDRNVSGGARYTLSHIGGRTLTPQIVDNLLDIYENENLVSGGTLFVLRNIIDKVLTTEVIKRLVSALRSSNLNSQHNVGELLRTQADKIATTETINQLSNLLESEREDVIRYACRILTAIGKKAETPEVINKLVNRVLNCEKSSTIQSIICSTLANMSNELIPQLLKGTNFRLRSSAGIAPTTTNEIINAPRNVTEDANIEKINQIEIELRDRNPQIRRNACMKLWSIGKAATANIIDTLINVTDDQNVQVREAACGAFGRIGEKAGTCVVIKKLMSLLDDKSADVRASACYALQEMGEKAMTSEAISKLVNALKDQNPHVRERACCALCQWSQKKLINGIIDPLAVALRDENMSVRWFARTALQNMIGQTPACELIPKFIRLLDSSSEYARETGCLLLGQLKEKTGTAEVIKAANRISFLGTIPNFSIWYLNFFVPQMCNFCTPFRLFLILSHFDNLLKRHNDRRKIVIYKMADLEVIYKLMNAVGDRHYSVRTKAWWALEQMSEQIDSTKIIDKVVNALLDKDCNVKISAWDFLQKISDNIELSELINKLIVPLNGDSPIESRNIAEMIGNKLNSPSLISELGSDRILKLCLSKFASISLKNVSEEQLIKRFPSNQASEWSSVIIKLALVRKTAMTINRQKIVIYGRTEPVELENQHLQKALIDQKKNLHLSFDL